jgi:glutathionyl-hydroquinone reductase
MPGVGEPHFRTTAALTIRQDHQTNILAYSSKDGSFERKQSQFRNFIENKPDAQFPAEKDRYHLYVSYACPWG